MELDELSRQRESEAGTFLFLGIVAAYLAELLKHRRLVLRRDADARITHRDDELIRVAARAHVDPAAVRREFDRVGQQVDQDLLEFALVGGNLAELCIDLLLERNAVALRALAH